jgi:hypothetical protein
MTRTIAVDSNNDIFVGPDGSLAIATAREAVLHCCAQAAKTQLGEMIYAVDQGLPNFGAVWNGAPNVGLFEAYLRRNLQAVPDVVSVDSVTIDATGGALIYVATIQTIYGPGAINGSV